MEDMNASTIKFTLDDKKAVEYMRILKEISEAMKEKGYDPVNQIIGYLLSEDPTYITTNRNARNLIRKIDRDDLLRVMTKTFIS